MQGGPDTRGKREFDRQSGMATTGVKSVDKRDGSGSYNWGSDRDQIEEQLKQAPAPELDTSTENVEKVSKHKTCFDMPMSYIHYMKWVFC